MTAAARIAGLEWKDVADRVDHVTKAEIELYASGLRMRDVIDDPRRSPKAHQDMRGMALYYAAQRIAAYRDVAKGEDRDLATQAMELLIELWRSEVQS
jgi:hypothetical protein